MEKKLLNKVEYHQYNTVVYKDSNPVSTQIIVDDEFNSVRRRRSTKWEFHHMGEGMDLYLLNYGVLSSSVAHDKITIVTEKYDNKISLKVFQTSKNRPCGSRFFKKTTKLSYLTYNTKTNDFYYGILNNYHKKRKCSKQVRKNSFNGKFEAFFNKIQNALKHFNEYSKKFVNEQEVILTGIFGSFFKEIPGFDENIKLHQCGEFLYYNYLVKKNIKYPNNYEKYLKVFPQPTLKIYRKYKNKMVDAFMGLNDLKGKKINAILNEATNLNFGFLKFMTSLFGYDYVISKDKNTVKQIVEYPNGFHGDVIIDENYRTIIEMMSSAEKNRVFNVVLDRTGDLHFWTFMDHLIFYQKIKKYEKIKWLANTVEEFKKEHTDWSVKVDEIQSGIIEREYDEKILNHIQQKIQFNGLNYYPVVLINSHEYYDESTVQSNCVKTYKFRPDSFIISLRKESTDNKERLTIDCFFRKDEFGEITLKRGQTRARFNENPKDEWLKVLEILDFRLSSKLYLQDIKLPVMSVTNKYGSSRHESYFNVSGILTWDNFDENELYQNNYAIQAVELQF